jgi:SAM-dependent methyltransferase
MMKNVKRGVELILEVEWESSLAKHVDKHYCKVNVWRECDLFPKVFQPLIEEGAIGDRMEVEYNAGELLPFDKGKIHECKAWQFYPSERLKHIRLRKGRFYPLGLFRGIPGIYAGNPYPGRVIALEENGDFVLDANHPLSRYRLKLKATIKNVFEKTSELGGRCKDHMESFLLGPGMQARYDNEPTDFGLEEKESFSRDDETPDTLFYSEPRLIGHIDRTCHENLLNFYAENLPREGKILDLMSSYESHLPEGNYEVIGLGINEVELKNNPRLNSYVVKDINADPSLPFEDEAFDVVVCDLSIEYVIKPLELLREVRRILKKDGRFFFSFSNRYFPPKVIKVWVDLHEFERMGFVLELLARTEGLGEFRTYSLRGFPRPVDDRWSIACTLSDPLYVVYGKRVS